MRIGTSIAIYFVIWWTVLFVVLPIRVRTQAESGRVVPGSEASAPERPALLMKAVLTTVIAAVVFLGFRWLYESGLGLDDVPFFPRYDR